MKIENSELYMSEEEFRGIINSYTRKPFFVGMDSCDLKDIFNLVSDLLEADYKALERDEPYATNTIRRLESARYEVGAMSYEVEDAFEEVYGK